MEGLQPTSQLINKLLAEPELVGISKKDLEEKGFGEQQKVETLLGEYYWLVSTECGRMAADNMMKAQWSHSIPEYFDQRIQFLNQETYCADHFIVASAKMLEAIPLDGVVLDLCCGNGYQPWAFWSKRASKVVAVDYDKNAIKQAKNIHKKANIEYVEANILEYDFGIDKYNTVMMRGAIEHFSVANQIVICKNIAKALKLTGCFCGDTPLNPKNNSKLLTHHENEWSTPQEAEAVLKAAFSNVQTMVMPSRDRTTIYWTCKGI
jgi:ubiquinone/menaquinone biosynthesis C-methylase UbiE